MFSFVECAIPLVAAPMAGGPSTPALVAAAAEAGGLGFLGGGYLTDASLGDRIRATRELTSAPFGVNLFVPGARSPASRGLDAYRRELQAEAGRYGIELPEPDSTDTDHYADKLALLCDEQPVAVVSFTFGLPGRDAVAALHAVDTCVAITVTNRHEARTAVERGADALVVQGPEAGGHRGTHDVGASADATPLIELVRAVRTSTTLPIVAAGGVSMRERVAELRAVGASVVAVGTALLRSPECGASQTHKDALASGQFTETRVTRAFSGRLARALVNRFVAEHDATAPAVYPEVNQLTRPIRAEAVKKGDAGGLALWAGTGYASARATGAADILRELAPHGGS
jgi:nitronate monooxygenase